MEGQARRTEYAVTDAACFRVRFTQRTPTVKALRTGRIRVAITRMTCKPCCTEKAALRDGFVLLIPNGSEDHVAVKTVALVAVPPAVVILILPVTAPVGTVAVTCVAELTVKAVAFTPPNVSAVVCVSPVTPR